MDMGTKYHYSCFTDDSGCLRTLKDYTQDQSQSLGVSLSCSSTKVLKSPKALFQKMSSGFDHDDIKPYLGMKQRWYEKE